MLALMCPKPSWMWRCVPAAKPAFPMTWGIAPVARLKALDPSLSWKPPGWMPLAGALAEGGIPVAVVNPRQVRDFASPPRQDGHPDAQIRPTSPRWSVHPGPAEKSQLSAVWLGAARSSDADGGKRRRWLAVRRESSPTSSG